MKIDLAVISIIMTISSKKQKRLQKKTYLYRWFCWFTFLELQNLMLVISIVRVCCTKKFKSGICCLFFSNFLLKINSISSDKRCCFINNCWKASTTSTLDRIVRLHCYFQKDNSNTNFEYLEEDILCRWSVYHSSTLHCSWNPLPYSRQQ